MIRHNILVVAIGAMALAAMTIQSSVTAATAGASGPTGAARQITKSGTAGFTSATGAAGVQGPEALNSADGALAPNRSHGTATTSVGAISQPKPVTLSHPELVRSFNGMNHFDQRFGSTAGNNQFSLEPPDQGLCVGSDGNGNTRVLEVLNDVLNVYDTSGAALAVPQALNGFLGYAPALDRSTGVFGPEVTDPSCVFDAATGHWFLIVFTIDQTAGGDFTGTNHLDLAVSNTADPTGSWTIYRIPTQDDGTDGTPNHHCSPGASTGASVTNPTACFADYPHIGSDANGIYLTTNEYSFFGPEFHGAQVYALSKTQLAALPANITVTQFDTHGLDSFGFALNGFTLWPSTTPGGGGDPSAGGTEYFLSSNAGAEAHDPGDGTSVSEPSTQLLVWALTNTSSLGTTPALTLSNTEVNVGVYAPPPSAKQKSGNQPLRTCLNNNSCSLVLEGIKDPFSETSANLDSNDSRMQQVMWVNGTLWGALDTALSISSAKQAGIEWFAVAPSTTSGSVSATLTNQGYVGLGNDNLIYPAIGITSRGTGVMAFTVVGSDFYPSAGYATITSAGVGPVHIAAQGLGPDDGFSNYKLFGPVTPGVARPRWGDYGAAVPMGNDVWIASEYIGQSCDFSTYKNSNFRCGNTRTALANWGTRISLIAAP
ncbi:MAG TPA: hypothetical protein VGN03_10375 [Steroidobacteraceae bacterium]|jgi:hypothetical protein